MFLIQQQICVWSDGWLVAFHSYLAHNWTGSTVTCFQNVWQHWLSHWWWKVAFLVLLNIPLPHSVQWEGLIFNSDRSCHLNGLLFLGFHASLTWLLTMSLSFLLMVSHMSHTEINIQPTWITSAIYEIWIVLITSKCHTPRLNICLICVITGSGIEINTNQHMYM